ncbi:hypothetical protein KDL45_16900, partial [bacterium]|nr:hypothetical protein [bacterium]
VCAFAVSVAAGCMRHTYDVGAGAPRGELVYDGWENKWIFGLVGETQIDLKDVCASGNATIHDETDFLTGLVGLLTFTIYRPSKVTIRCADGSTGQIELDQETAAKIATQPEFLAYVEAVNPLLLDQAKTAVENAQAFLNAKTVAQR